MSRRGVQREELLRKITRGIVLDTGTREQIALQYAAAVMRVLDEVRADNGMVYVPARDRQYDVLQIRAAFDRGESAKQIQRAFNIGRSKLHGLFPGGLPVASKKTG